MTSHAIVLARGLGTRMRAPDDQAQLTPDQARVAAMGLKSMMPVNGRPFLDYVLSSLADAGLSDVGLVVAPDHGRLREIYERHPPARVRLAFVVQEQPRGTANAVLAAQNWLDGRPFLCLNADNLYPVAALTDLAALDDPGLPAFSRDDLIASSNIPPERIRAFAIIEVDDQGWLTRVVEKPTEMDLPPEGGGQGGKFVATIGNRVAVGVSRKHPLISMNCWRFDSRIFDACREVPKSTRGEFELPEAVGLAVSRRVRFRVLPARGPVLDLSRRSDAAELARRLVATTPRP